MININNDYYIIGVMSGTSMDGLDVSYSRYYQKKNIWSFDLIHAETYSYPEDVKSSFIKAFNKEIGLDFIDIKFGHFISDKIKLFIKKYKLHVDLISSHGHTIFHDPTNFYTKQVGSGSVISKNLSIPVVCNFRNQDIRMGGQGAPLVPIGDKLLFSHYDACLNLGGIANISYDEKGFRIAYDICPCNMILNYLSQISNKTFDDKGVMAANGTVNFKLLNILNKIKYYHCHPPKSLSKEYVDSFFLSLFDVQNTEISNLLSTFVEHIAIQISNALSNKNITKLLISGGGAFNDYLILRIKHYVDLKIVIPSAQLVNYKESIIFGFLGLLRILKENNCLASATGAKQDHCSGDLYLP